MDAKILQRRREKRELVIISNKFLQFLLRSKCVAGNEYLTGAIGITPEANYSQGCSGGDGGGKRLGSKLDVNLALCA